MPAATVPKNAISTGAGYLYVAAMASALPANTVAGSIFTDTWPGAWALLGITKAGHEFDYTVNTDTIEAAEYLDPIMTVITGRVTGVKMELQQVHATNLKRALNGGTLAVSGSGATQLNTFQPPNVGAEVRTMVGWEAQDNTERWVMEQALQVGSLTIARNKGSANATLPLEFHAEVAASGFPFQWWTAGTLRG